jgi:hypothetical protein
MRDKDDPARSLVIEALAAIGPAAKEAIPDLEEALRTTRDPRTAYALARVDPKKTAKAVTALVDVLRADDPAQQEMRSRAVEALGKLGPDAAAALPALGELFRNSDANLRLVVIQAVRTIDPDAVAKLARP